MSSAEDVIEVGIRLLDPGVDVPTYAQPFDAGADLVSTTDLQLAPGERSVVGTGVAVSIPAGWAGFIHPRSGLAARHGLTVVNAPGTIDAGYRGEIKVCLLNTDSAQPISIRRGDRIAQLVLQRVGRADFVITAELDESVRGEAGYGSSGGVAGWTGTDQEN